MLLEAAPTLALLGYVITMEIQITLEEADWKNYLTCVRKEVLASHKSWINSVWVDMFIFWVMVTILIMLLLGPFRIIHVPTALTILLFFLLLFIFFLVKGDKAKTAFKPSKQGIFYGTHTFIFDDNGIVSKGDGYKSEYSWKIIQKITKSPSMILIYLDTVNTLIFPTEKLENPEKFYGYIQKRYSRAVSD